MRGVSTGSGGGMVNMILKVAPIAFSFFAFMFLAIALSSGVKEGYLEGLNVINFNMSTLGKDLIKDLDLDGKAKPACDKAGKVVDETVDKVKNGAVDTANTVKNGAEDAGKKIGSFFGGKTRRDPASSLGDVISDGCNGAAEVADKAVKLTADVVNKAAGSVAKAIGIEEYYSVHIGVLCSGMYKPNFKDPKAAPDVKKCSPKFKAEQTDISKKLDQELKVGPFKFKPSDLGIVDKVADAFDLIPRAFAALAYFYLFAVLALVLGFFMALATLAFEYKMQGAQKFALLGGLGSIGLGWFTSLIGVAGITIVAEKIKAAVNEKGEKFGMSAQTNPAMYFLIWASLANSTAALAVLAFVWWRTRKGKGGVAANEAYAEKNQSGSSMEDSHGFYQEPVNGGGQQMPQQQYQQGGY